MTKKRQNESQKDIYIYNYIKEKLFYKNDWVLRKTKNKIVQQILDKSSKKNTGNRGEPDFIYVNEQNKLLILIENKDSIQYHESKKNNKPELYAVDGIKHYLSFFKNENLKNNEKYIFNYLNDWKIVGIAISGNILDEYNSIISNFIIINNNIVSINAKEILDEEEYLNLFENINLEQITDNISKSSNKLNSLLRNIDSQKRPILLSALMICLFEKNNIVNDFKNEFIRWESKTIAKNIPIFLEEILKKELIPTEKIDILKNELAFMKTDSDILNSDILKSMLIELNSNILPLFKKKSNYDIIGKFYEEFLKYAGVSNVKKGIVLTPNHITTLFTELIDIKYNDIIFDPCCGTGAFLISGMNKIIEIINNSDYENKKEKISTIKEKQIIGFDKSSLMYSLAISNMLFRGDGKSRIFNVDFFSNEADLTLKSLKKEGISPSISFLNPPYGGKDTNDNPTKKEIQFLTKVLDITSRYVIIISPCSIFISDNVSRNKILSKHTLKYVINMPSDLFQPNASVHTSIAVFETNKPHNNKEVLFYDLKDDGLVLSRSKGRTDPYNKWQKIKNEMINIINNNKDSDINNLTFLRNKIGQNDEWVIQAHSDTDYSQINDEIFERNIREYVIFKFFNKLNISDKKFDYLKASEILYLNNIFKLENIINKKNNRINISDIKLWKPFKYEDIFYVEKGKRLKKQDQIDGNIPYIISSSNNNGIDNYICNGVTHKAPFISVACYGSIGETFYQEIDSWVSDNCNVLIPKFNINIFIAMFLCSLIRLEKERYSYGFTGKSSRMEKMIINLPVNSQDSPNWKFMEDYIKCLPYSSNL